MHVRLMGLDRACCGNETDIGRIGHVLPCMSQAIWYAMFTAMGWASDPGRSGLHEAEWHTRPGWGRHSKELLFFGGGEHKVLASERAGSGGAVLRKSSGR